MDVIRWEATTEDTVEGEVSNRLYTYEALVKNSIEGWYGEVRVKENDNKPVPYTKKDMEVLLMYDGFASVEEAMRNCQRVVTRYSENRSATYQLQRKVMLASMSG